MKMLKMFGFTKILMSEVAELKNRWPIQMFLLYLLLHQASCDPPINNDTQTLMNFKYMVDATDKLGWGVGNPCNQPWRGVKCHQGRIIHLALDNWGLHGSASILRSLDQLTVLSLSGNFLNGSLPDASEWQNLQYLHLDHNQFSGEIPTSMSSLVRLVDLRLSYNSLSGEIPTYFGNFSHLSILRLENNRLTGRIPSLNFTKRLDFNVSNNQLSGNIPSTLDNFSNSSFVGNSQLCGAPLPPCKLIPGSSSSPSPLFSTGNSPIPIENRRADHRLSTGAIIAIVLGDVAGLVVITLLFLFYYWKKYSKTLQKPSLTPEQQVGQYSVPIPEAEKGRLIFFTQSNHKFELEELLRASAEMLGKGNFGTTYKAALESGIVVAVKRLKDTCTSGRKEFEQHMELIGNLTHPNLARLQAYYYEEEEKLLIYDYMPNGSLYFLLHANRGTSDRTPLDWTTRLKIALGAAHGLSYIHRKLRSQKMPHGNIKSTNILQDKDGNPCISDFGLAILMNARLTSLSAGYRAPEHNETTKLSQRADVYSFGIVLLEMLTGKSPTQSQGQEHAMDLPGWVQSVVREEWTAEVFDPELMRYKNIEEELVGMLQIAMVCVSPFPEQRPKINQVVKMIEDIRGDQSPLGNESSGSCPLSPISEGTPPVH